MTSGAELSAVRANWGKAKALFAVSGWDKHTNAPPRSARPHGASSSAIFRSLCSLLFVHVFALLFRGLLLTLSPTFTGTRSSGGGAVSGAGSAMKLPPIGGSQSAR